MRKGLIVSVQGFSKETTQELANICVYNGAVGIRTDQHITLGVPIIALEKSEADYYITTTTDSIDRCKWGGYVAIDCRRGNKDLQLLLSYAHMSNVNVVADVDSVKDVIAIEKLCKKRKIVRPRFYATTFSFYHVGEMRLPGLETIEQIAQKTDVPIIAEGAFKMPEQVATAFKLGAHNVCIGEGITGIKEMTRLYIERGVYADNRTAKIRE